MSLTTLARTLGILALGFMVMLPGSISADTYPLKWSGSQPKLDFTTAGGKFDATLSGAMVTVHYRVKVQEVNASGAVVRELSCGDSVPEGTRVQYSFDTHKYTDISWFGTGGSNDSPYGMWMNYGTQPSPAKRCEADNLYQKNAHKANLYAELTIQQPNKSVTTNMRGCSNGANGLKTCTAGVGTYNATYTFAATRGNFWGGWLHTNEGYKNGQCYAPSRNYRGVDQRAMRHSGSVYPVAIPQKTFNCTIIGVKAPEDPHDPNKPTVTANTAACVAGQAHSIKIKGTDPDGDDVRYQIDWLNNGTITYLPENRSYVNSGTELTASKTFATAGSKTVKVRTEDEHGGKSAWTTLTFTCTEGADVCPNLTGTQPVVPQDYQIVGGQCVPIDPNLDQCTNITGIQSTIPPGLIRIGSECLEGEFGDGPSINDLSLTVKPTLVRRNDTTRISWSSQNMTACTVTGTNSDTWTGLKSPAPVGDDEGGETSSAITTTVIYTLSCRGTDGETYTKTGRVGIVPIESETSGSGGR